MIAGLHTFDPESCERCLCEPVPSERVVSHGMNFCLWCGAELAFPDYFCSSDCADAADSDERCFVCEQAECICPPPRRVATVATKGDLL